MDENASNVIPFKPRRKAGRIESESPVLDEDKVAAYAEAMRDGAFQFDNKALVSKVKTDRT